MSTEKISRALERAIKTKRYYVNISAYHGSCGDFLISIAMCYYIKKV